MFCCCFFKGPSCITVLACPLASYSSLPYFRFQSSAFTSNSLFYSVGFLLAKAASAQLQQRSIDGKIETGYRNKQRLVAPDNCQSCQKHELKTKMCQFYTSCCRECLLQLWVLVLTSKQSLTPTHNGYFRLQLSSLNQQDKLCFTECACMCCSCTATCKKKILTPELLCRLFLKFSPTCPLSVSSASCFVLSACYLILSAPTSQWFQTEQ